MMMKWSLSVLVLLLSTTTLQAQYVDRTKVTEAVAATATLQSVATANGNGSTLDVSGYSSVSFVVTGTFTATVNFEVTSDDTNWVALQVVQTGTSTVATSSTTTGTFSATIGALKSVRARISGYASGSVTVTARANLSQGPSPYVITGTSLPLPTGAATSTKQSDGSQKSQVVDGSGNVIGSTSNALDVNIKSGNPTSIQANAGTNLNTSALALSSTQTDGTQKTRITDGTNDVAVKAASTAASATDKALVVAVSPNNTVGVTGTFWQATQPISASSLPLPSTAATSTKQSDGSQKTQIVDGSANVIGSTSNALDVNIKSGNPTTIAVTQATASSLNADANVKTIGGNTVLTGNGVTGTGSQRVTIASDNTPFAVKTDQTTHGTTDLVAADVTKIAGTTALTGNGNTGAGSQRVTIATDNTPFAVKIDQTTHGTTDQVAADLTKVAGTAVVDGGPSGTLGVGGPDANNAAITGNPIIQGVEAQSGQPTAATTGNVRQLVGSLDGGLYVRQGGPVTWTCGVNGVAASLSQCQAAPGANLKLYITGLYVQTTTTTSGTYALQTGTGSNCGTGTAALFPVSGTANRFNAPVTSNAMASITFPVPLVAPTNTAVCLIGVATNTISAQLVGFTAP